MVKTTIDVEAIFALKISAVSLHQIEYIMRMVQNNPTGCAETQEQQEVRQSIFEACSLALKQY